MLNAVNKTISDAMQAMNNSLARMYFQFANVYVKATPEQLLDISYNVGSSSFKIEDMAQVMVADEYTFHVLPLSKGFTELVTMAFTQEKPQFKQKLFKNPYGEVPEDAEQAVKDRWPDMLLAVAMPDVTSDLKDIYDKGVDYLHDITKTAIEVKYTEASTKLKTQLIDFPKDFADAQIKKLDNEHDSVVKRMEEYYEKKKRDIEEAYNYYESFGERPVNTNPVSFDDSETASSSQKPDDIYKKGAMSQEEKENDGSVFNY